jgi:hypothetical protein
MRKEPTTRLLHLARLFAAEHAGISLDEIATRFAVSRRTAERMRDAVAEVFPQLEEIEDARPKRWRLPSGLSGLILVKPDGGTMPARQELYEAKSIPRLKIRTHHVYH